MKTKLQITYILYLFLLAFLMANPSHAGSASKPKDAGRDMYSQHLGYTHNLYLSPHTDKQGGVTLTEWEVINSELVFTFTFENIYEKPVCLLAADDEPGPVFGDMEIFNQSGKAISSIYDSISTPIYLIKLGSLNPRSYYLKPNEQIQFKHKIPASLNELFRLYPNTYKGNDFKANGPYWLQAEIVGYEDCIEKKKGERVVNRTFKNALVEKSINSIFFFSEPLGPFWFEEE